MEIQVTRLRIGMSDMEASKVYGYQAKAEKLQK